MLHRHQFLACATVALLVGSASISAANCDARAAKPALGRRYTQELAEHMRQASGASQVVQHRRGMAYTMESKTDRLILSTAADATIIGVDCN
jgi:hypothetical protein